MNPVGPRHELLVTRLTMHFAPAVAGRLEVHVRGSPQTGRRGSSCPTSP